MRALLVSPLGFLIGLSLGALGGGGSILAVPVLVYAAGQDPKAATATSLFLVGTAALVGLQPHLKAGRVRVRTGVMFGMVGVAGSLVGSKINQQIDPDVLLLCFSGLVLVAAWRMLTGCPTCTRVGELSALAETEAPSPRDQRRSEIRSVLLVIAAGTLVGLLSGLFGVGGGFIIVPALTLVLKLPMPQAIGTSLLVIAINSAVALATRLATTDLDWAVTLPFTLSAVLGVLVGGRIADRIDARKSLQWFAGLLVTVAIYTALRAGIALMA